MTRPSTTLLVLAAFVMILFPSAASAHVTVSPGTAEPGGYARVVFRVPNERADASTTRLEVSFPAEHRFSSVSVQPVSGWTATTVRDKQDAPADAEEKQAGNVTAIVWEGGTVQPGQFQEFPVSMGKLPLTNTKLAFKAVQTYSSGEVVRWIDVQQDGGPRPEHPAPMLTVAAPPLAAAPAARVDLLGRVLGGAGLVGALVAIGLSLGARKRPFAPADGVGLPGKDVQGKTEENEPARV